MRVRGDGPGPGSGGRRARRGGAAGGLAARTRETAGGGESGPEARPASSCHSPPASPSRGWARSSGGAAAVGSGDAKLAADVWP